MIKNDLRRVDRPAHFCAMPSRTGKRKALPAKRKPATKTGEGKGAKPLPLPPKDIAESITISEAKALIKKAKVKDQQKSAVKKFRPTKKDRQSFILVDEKGKRIDKKSRKKGWMVYVDGKGKKKIIRDDNDKGDKNEPITPRRASNWHLFRSGKKVAIQKYYVDTKCFGIKDINGPWRDDDGGIDWTGAAQRMGSELEKRVGEFKNKGTFRLDVSVILTGPDGTVESPNISVAFGQRAMQEIKSKGYVAFCKNKIYHFLSDWWISHGYVTIGSTEWIAGLKDNEDVEDPAEYVDQYGKPWRGRNLEQVSLDKISMRICKVMVKK